MKTKDLKKMVRSIIESARYEPMRFKDLCTILDIHNKRDRKMLGNLLEEMVRSGRIKYDEKGRYFSPKSKPSNLSSTPKKADTTGILQGHLKGFGFVIPDDSLFEKDIFIPSNCLNGALDQDHVSIKITSKSIEDKRPEGEVVEILERGHDKIVGRFERHKTYGFVIADNDRLCKDIFIPERHMLNAETGDKVVVNITVWPDGRKKPEGKIIEILGKATDPGIDVLSVFREHAIETTFNADVLLEAETLKDYITPQELKKRRDLRENIIFTIDGDHAKDFDDAVSLSMNERGHFLLGVHIADVSHFIKKHGAIDNEALERSTSIYAIDQVVPMLPFKLSNDLCSLRPFVDRLSFSCIMEIDSEGNVVNSEIFKSVIHSKARMTYTSVNTLLDGIHDETTAYLTPFESILLQMKSLASVLYNERRVKRGAIDFDFPEAEITLGSDGIPTCIEARERGVSERIIEEFMLLANETIATFNDQTG
ncbi:MAG: RNB domain-containing ribonuclease, partial [Eubacterium sp.]